MKKQNINIKIEKVCHAEKLLLSISRLLGCCRLITTNNKKKGGPELPLFRTTTCFNNAFNLIELLVVVLIIGILAAVAVPQYQKAVAKARFVELKMLAKQLYDAEQIYHLANGKYSGQRDELGVSFGPVPSNTADYFIPFAHGICSINAALNRKAPYVTCQLTNPHLELYLYVESTRRMCCNYELNNSTLDQICKEETQAVSTYDDTTTRHCYVKE